MGLHRTLQLSNFVHHLLVDRDTTCGINHNHIVVVFLGKRDGIFSNCHGIIASVFAVHFNAHLFAQHFQLLTGSRTIDITRNKQWISAQPLEVFTQFPCESGFSRTLKSGD